MPIATADIDYYESTFSASGIDSLGGAITANEITSGVLHNLFDIVSGAEATSGRTEYRCFYVKNNDGTRTMQSAKVWLHADTTETDTTISFAKGSSGVNGTEQSVADETTAPTGVTWQSLEGEGNAQTLGDIPPGQHHAIWVRRVVDAGAAAVSSTTPELRVKCDSAA